MGINFAEEVLDFLTTYLEECSDKRSLQYDEAVRLKERLVYLISDEEMRLYDD